MFRMKAGLLLLAACLLPAGAARGQAALSVRVSSQEVLVGDPVQVSVLLSGADAEPAGVPAFERPDAAPLAVADNRAAPPAPPEDIAPVFPPPASWAK